ncbi:glycerol-3-phosphate 1-O-acyltransferase PlsY [Bacteroidota bacterium]
MITSTNILLFILAYLLGSIPTAVWIGKIFYNKDVREYGSKNAGASNTFRILGIKAGIPVLIIDILKGYAAVNLAHFSTIAETQNENFVIIQLFFGIAGVIGHIFPIYAGFRGGKGVATLLGFVIAIHPFAALISVGIFVLCLIKSRYVSLSSMLAGITFPITLILIFKITTISLALFSILVAILIIITHKNNIGRLLRKEELKANIFRNKKEK